MICLVYGSMFHDLRVNSRKPEDGKIYTLNHELSGCFTDHGFMPLMTSLVLQISSYLTVL